MDVKQFERKTISEIAAVTHVFWKPIRVFLLEDETDSVGKHLMDVYSMQQIIDAFPAAAAATIVSAVEFYGDTVLRIRLSPNTEPTEQSTEAAVDPA